MNCLPLSMARSTVEAAALARISETASPDRTSWEHMPFFLVTQISLVEAQDEQEAAQKGVNRLRSGEKLTVSVKSDKTTIAQVVVAAKVARDVADPASQ